MAALDLFHPAVAAWFGEALGTPTPAQARGWPVIARGESALVLAPTGSGKTLAAFLWAIDRVMFEPTADARCRVLYISPLKALAVDIERNLRAPVAGIAHAAAARGEPCHVPAVSVRTGDTPARDRARFLREPADILVTTPESLFLLLTSRARDRLRTVEMVIVDEVHALLPTKRGAHLALSLERLETLAGRRLQRIGLSATLRPVDEAVRFLGGADRPPAAARRATPRQAASARHGLDKEFAGPASAVRWRPVTVVDTRTPKALDLRVESPLEELARSTPRPAPAPGVPAAPPSIWQSLHPRLLALVRAHRTTLVFVNSRRLAERMAGALNELAGETIARAHHGSLARTQRLEIEEELKAGRLRALTATSSLELGIDMGAIDLVVQIEAPPSVTSGLQRIGRAGHRISDASTGVIVPKYRSDLVAAAAVTRLMRDGHVEATRYPRNPLDVLAQQVVAMAAMDAWQADDLFATIRTAAPFAALGRRAFDGVLDMLSGRYPSDDFAELRPRITWDRVRGTITARAHARTVVVANAGTIPDRGLYGVFLTGAAPAAGRVGELDEEMVFESRVGDTFVLGASTWRIDTITHDRVLVSPAPGEPGRMPFWKGEQPARPRELGAAIGRLSRELLQVPAPAALDRLTRQHDLDPAAAEQVLRDLADQQAATRAVPDDRTVVVERCRDELGDWRVCLLSPLGGQVLVPWTLAAIARVRDETGLDVETMWGNDGFVVRFPEGESPPDARLLLPGPDDVEDLLVRQLGSSALFAAKFREVAGRALLLPRRRPGRRAALWQQRKRAADLLAVASRFGSFPAVLETYRECLRDLFDLPALVETLRAIREGALRVVTVDTPQPSPFAASLLFSYVGNFLYDGDAPLAERRAQALAVDQAELRELIGDTELRDLIDPDSLRSIEAELQRLDERHRARSADDLHDLLRVVGDLDEDEIASRVAPGQVSVWIDALRRARRVFTVTIAGRRRLIAAEDMSRYRDGLGVRVPRGVAAAWLEPVVDPLGDLVLRFARTHGPFTREACASRLGLDASRVEEPLGRLAATGRLVRGEFRPGGSGLEWCEAGVLAALRRRSLARWRKEVEPVDGAALGRFAMSWHGLGRRRRGLDALVDAVDQLQGAVMPASLLERAILPARIEGYQPADLDRLIAAGEIVWVGVDRLGDRDGRIALYLTDRLRLLWPGPPGPAPVHALEQRIVSFLAEHGASFFAPIHEAAGGGYPPPVVEALWALVWQGIVTNDSLHALRAFLEPPPKTRRERATAAQFRSRRVVPPVAQGRWSLVSDRLDPRPSPAESAAATAQQLLARHGIVTREAVLADQVPGGFTAAYRVFRTMEEAGQVRRGLFVAGLGAAQFGAAPAVELLRSLRESESAPRAVTLAAADPANPYGAIMRWPSAGGTDAGGPRPSRAVGATVVLVDGALAAYLTRGDRDVLVWLPDAELARERYAGAVAGALAGLATGAESGRGGLLVSTINGQPAEDHALAPFLEAAGFVAGPRGLALARKD